MQAYSIYLRQLFIVVAMQFEVSIVLIGQTKYNLFDILKLDLII